MKVLAFLSIFTSMQAMAAGRLGVETLDCRAINGGSIESGEIRGKQLVVYGQFGFAKKKYYALLKPSMDSSSTITLMDMNGRMELNVSALLDLEERGTQRVSAYISFVNAPLMGVSANCEIRVKDF